MWDGALPPALAPRRLSTAAAELSHPGSILRIAEAEALRLVGAAAEGRHRLADQLILMIPVLHAITLRARTAATTSRQAIPPGRTS
jgi:hypothetical protein